MTLGPFHQLELDPSLALLIDESAIVRVSKKIAEELSRGDVRALSGWVRPPSTPRPLSPREPKALSLNVATGCNLGCGYCYADAGRFGGVARPGMSQQTMRAAVDRLLEANRGGAATLGFIGGEPFANASLVHDAVEYAEQRAAALHVTMRYGVTTNGTLLRTVDLELLRNHEFAVTVSVDGGAALHDRLRPTGARKGSLTLIVAKLGPLLENPGRARIGARATLTRLDFGVGSIIRDVHALGFQEIGVAPLVTGPRNDLALREHDMPALLCAMREAADAEVDRLLGGKAPVFTNLLSAMRELHQGSRRSLPCGAADNYISMSAEGRYFTCHRTIDDERFGLGDVGSGIDHAARMVFVEERRVEHQDPCRSCWARHLCGGGCHAEVIATGRIACEYIRGWLETCIVHYDNLVDKRPDLFEE